MIVLVHSLYQLIQSWTILAFGHTCFLKNKCMQTQVSMGTGFQNIVTVFDCFHMHQSWPGPRLAAHMQSHQWRTAFSHHSCDVMKQVVLMSCALNLMLLNMHLVAILDAVGGHISQLKQHQKGNVPNLTTSNIRWSANFRINPPIYMDF